MEKIQFPILAEIGLSEAEAAAYGALLAGGRMDAAAIAKASGLGRGNAYHAVARLRARGLAKKVGGRGGAAFECASPEALRPVVAQRALAAERAAAEFERAVGPMSALFRRSTGQPTVEVYEGTDGLKEAIFDTLGSRTEILAYADVRAISGDLADANARYVRERRKRGVAKRILVADTAEARAFFATQQPDPYTSVAFVPGFPARFGTASEIYDDSVSHLTLTDNKRIAVIIRDPSLYEFHRAQFEFAWGLARDVIAPTPRPARPRTRGRGPSVGPGESRAS